MAKLSAVDRIVRDLWRFRVLAARREWDRLHAENRTNEPTLGRGSQSSHQKIANTQKATISLVANIHSLERVLCFYAASVITLCGKLEIYSNESLIGRDWGSERKIYWIHQIPNQIFYFCFSLPNISRTGMSRDDVKYGFNEPSPSIRTNRAVCSSISAFWLLLLERVIWKVFVDLRCCCARPTRLCVFL